MMRSSYPKEDVTLLLKDVTGMISPLDTSDREHAIQSGVHYSEMLPLEYKPSDEYMRLYKLALSSNAKRTACAAATLAEQIYSNGKRVLVSLARAGTPIGILIRRYIKKKYNLSVPHYTISIIRGRGIDKNAISYILERHAAKDVQFIDGWTGKGAIASTLAEALRNTSLSAELGVLSDPAGVTPLCGTREDFLIPSACLNATVSGLFSRTILNDKLIGETDFHGAVYYSELESEDVSMEFINEVERHMVPGDIPGSAWGAKEAFEIAQNEGICDMNFLKPGIGETTRVLLRRVPHKILIAKEDDPDIYHILRLASEKSVPVQIYPLKNYRAAGIIKKL